MKNNIKIFAIGFFAISLVSCTTHSTVGNPNQDDVIYRSPDGGIFRQGEIYRDRNGNVYRDGVVIRTGDVINLPGIIGNNGVILYPGTNPRNLPPGQAKKIFGGRAKDYAPGQIKKRYDGDDYPNRKLHKMKKPKKDKYFKGY